MGLGPYPAISLAEAREKARQAKKAMVEGNDPLAVRRAAFAAARLDAAKTKTFREAVLDFIARNEAGWRNAVHRQQWHATLETYIYPVLGDLPVQAIDTGLVVQVLDPI